MTVATDQSIIPFLDWVRADYEAECHWHRFLMDAASGTGGFKGRHGPTAISHFGWAAEAYAHTLLGAMGVTMEDVYCSESYLDRFPRETDEKFRRRREVAHLTNYVAPILDLLISYVNKGEFGRENEPEALTKWRADADGNGSSWDVLLKDVIRLLAGQLGWIPVLVDMPVNTQRVSVAQRDQLGLVPRVIPLFPVNILDWSKDASGELTAIKIKTREEQRDNLLALPTFIERYDVWYRDRVERYVVTTPPQGPRVAVGPDVYEHGFGAVPVVSFRGRPTPGDRMRGMSIVGDIAVANRRHFNTESEMDEVLRGNTFPILGVPVQDMEVNLNDLLVGSGNGIKVPMESHLPLHYIAPPAQVAAAYESRLAALVKEIYRCARVEYEAPTGTATSGVARAYQFEGTNRRLGDLASGFARSEEKLLRLVAKALNADATKMRVTAPSNFALEDLTADIQNVLELKQVGLGPTAEVEMTRRVRDRALPNLSEDAKATSDQEIQDMADQAVQSKAMDAEMEAAQHEANLAGAAAKTTVATATATGATPAAGPDLKRPIGTGTVQDDPGNQDI